MKLARHQGVGVRKVTEQDPGKATRAEALGCERAAPVSTASRAKGPDGRSPPGGVLGARTSSEWASFIQAFGPDPRRNEDHQLVFWKRTTQCWGHRGVAAPNPGVLARALLKMLKALEQGGQARRGPRAWLSVPV